MNLTSIITFATSTANRFPRPDFESGYQSPATEAAIGRAMYWDYVDTGVLAVMLMLAAWFALNRKSRTGLMSVAVFSVFYFGFFKKGCVCSIGSIQNIVVYFTQGGPALSFAVMAFFLLPLVFAIWFGRVFCSSVCPFGALQEMVQYKPIRVPRAVELVLGLIPYAYLSLAILFAATGTTFLICRYDPFITLFRLSGDLDYVLLTSVFILLSMIIARPYCRFLCPYGVLLKWAAFFSKFNIKNTTEACVGCRLCEDACTISAIHSPIQGELPEKVEKGTSRILRWVVLIPVFMLMLGWSVSRLDGVFASMHPTVALANDIITTPNVENPEHPAYWDLRAWQQSGRGREDIMNEANSIIHQFHIGGWWVGGFLGLVLGISLIRLSQWRTYTHPETDVSSCVSCGRCFISCPLKKMDFAK